MASITFDNNTIDIPCPFETKMHSGEDTVAANGTATIQLSGNSPTGKFPIGFYHLEVDSTACILTRIQFVGSGNSGSWYADVRNPSGSSDTATVTLKAVYVDTDFVV